MAPKTSLTYRFSLLAYMCLILFTYSLFNNMQTKWNYNLYTVQIGPESGIEREVSDSEWIKYFSFVPHRLVDCEDLFSDRNKFDPYPEHYKRWIAEHAEFTSQFKFEEGYSFTSVEENMVMHELVNLPFVKTVCETGFNAGHSALLWLSARNDTELFSFDIGEHPYARPIAQWFMDKFPGRFHIQWGRSSLTLPKFRHHSPEVTCDLMIIDGGHFYEPAKADLDNFFLMASADSIVFLDNYPMDVTRCMEQLGKVWEDGKKTGKIIELFNCQHRNKIPSIGRNGFSVGRFNNLGYKSL